MAASTTMFHRRPPWLPEMRGRARNTTSTASHLNNLECVFLRWSSNQACLSDAPSTREPVGPINFYGTNGGLCARGRIGSSDAGEAKHVVERSVFEHENEDIFDVGHGSALVVLDRGNAV